MTSSLATLILGTRVRGVDPPVGALALSSSQAWFLLVQQRLQGLHGQAARASKAEATELGSSPAPAPTSAPRLSVSQSLRMLG